MDVKPLFLRTYGKQKRQLTAWISPERHKRAFDSSRSTDSDVSEFEPPKPTKTRMKSVAANHRVARPARKKKATLQLTNSFDEKNSSREPNVENIIFSPFPYSTTAQQNKSKRRKKTSVKDRAVRPAKKTKSSDEENVCKPSPTNHQQVQQSKTARRNNLVLEPGVPIKHKPDQVPAGSYSEIDWTSAPQSRTASVATKRRSNVPSLGHFVTRRRCTTKHQLPKGKISVLNSSGDFSSGAFSASRNLRPFRRARVPSTFILSSAENSVNVAGASCVPTNPLQEIFLNESSDPSIRPCSSKPIFCSTPTAGSLRKHPRLKPFPINDLSSMPLSISVNCIDSLSTLQNDVDSPDPVASQSSVPPTVVSSHEMQHLDLSKKERALHQHNEPSGDFFMESKTTDTSEDNKKPSEDPQTKSGEELCLNLLSSNNESSSNFVNTSGALEWLVQTLKEKCLTEQCAVLLERLDIASLTQLCSQTTYSSCLGDEYFVKSLQNNEHPVSVDSGQTADLQQSSVESFNTFLSVTDHRNGKSLLPVNSLDYSEQAPSLNDSQSSNLSPSVDSKQSAECSSTSEFIRPSVVSDESVYYLNSSAEVTMNTEESASNTVQTEDVDAIKDKCCIKKCTVHLKKLSLSQLIYEQLKGFEQQNESHLTFNDGAADPNSETENDHTCDVNTPKDLVYVGAIQSNNPEMKKIPMSTRALKVNTLSNKLTVNVQRITLSELRDTLNPTGRKPNSPTAVSDPDSDNQSLSDTNHCNEVSSLQRLTHSNDKISTNTEGTLPTRRKMSVARKERKRRSTSRDRPGTTRKACVSGLSVNRWRTQSSTSSHVFRGQRAPGHVKALDCSLDELISSQHKQQQLLGPAMNFSTPVRASELNLSSVLADMTPRSYTWSRLKAALSVHRKGMVLLTPRTVAASGSPGGAHLSRDLSRDLFASPFRTPLPKHLKSQLHRNDSLVVCEDLSDAEKVYAECGQPRALPWEECILPHRMKQCVKIGEGTFGEVFSTTNASGDTVALKIIPVEGSEKVNGEDQKTFGEILHEIIISKELSSLKEKRHNQTRSFIGLNDLHCVQGCYPPDFLDAWDRFDQQKGSENDRPDFFQRDQIFLILEFEFGGIDLENSNGTLASLGVARSILHQVTAALAVAEQELHFEHRDLHWGNILVKTTKQKKGSFLLNGMTHSLETKGVLVRIIDYSLSRLEIDELTVSCDISKDEELFMGQGDYQFEIYRLMRKENGNNWSDYHPHTNVLWLHYLCSKLLSMKYRGTGGRGAKQIREELTRFYDGVLHYSSATEVLQHSPVFQ